MVVKIHTLSLHAHGKALLVTAVLAAIALPLVHKTLFAVSADVAQVLPHCALKEAFTALAAVHTIVFS